MKALLKKPSAWLPLAMSVGALTLPYLAVLIFGPDPTGDEGVAAHLWQPLVGLQVPVIFFFAIKYIPHKPREALHVVALQIIGILAACAPVWYFKL